MKNFFTIALVLICPLGLMAQGAYTGDSVANSVDSFNRPGCRKRLPKTGEVHCFLRINKKRLPSERAKAGTTKTGFNFTNWLSSEPEVFAKTDQSIYKKLKEGILSLFETENYILSINNKVAGEELHFTEGDIAVIHVTNALPKAKTSLHWHGILLPWDMDGVPGVTTPQINPQETRIFRFELKQSGTYWYHSHTDVQEQQGVYGAFIVDPKPENKIYHVDHDIVVVLSDWSDLHPDLIMAYLKSNGSYMAWKKDFIPSWAGAFSEGAAWEYFQLLKSGMEGLDYGDVGYDHALVNGSSMREFSQRVILPGERVRLRVINAGASSHFYVDIGSQAFDIIAADGVNVAPLKVMSYGSKMKSSVTGLKNKPHMDMGAKDGKAMMAKTEGDGMSKGMSTGKGLMLGMGETYDLLFKVPEKSKFGGYELRATMRDGTHYSSLFLGDSKSKIDTVARRSKLSNYKMEMSGGMGMKMDEGAEASNINSMDGADSMDNGMGEMGGKGLKFPYSELRSLVSTHRLPKKNADNKKPIVFDMTLSGDMSNYQWEINGTTLSQQNYINIKRDHIIQFKITNKTMMRHPMHLHGHFFRLLNQHKDFSPLKHTVDVGMGETITIEFLADAYGDWLFHCHNLYHMKTGMAKIIHYEGFEFAPSRKQAQGVTEYLNGQILKKERKTLVTGDRRKKGGGSVSFLTNEVEFEVVLRGTDYEVQFEGEVDEYKLEQIKLELYLHYYWYKNFSVFGGVRYEDQEPAGVVGGRYLAPFDFEISLASSVQTDGITRVHFKIEHETSLSKHLSLDLEAEASPLVSSSRKLDEEEEEFKYDLEARLNYRFMNNLYGVFKFKYEEEGASVGVGVRLDFPVH